MQTKGSSGARVLRCHLSARCAELSWKETVPNPPAETSHQPALMPAGAADPLQRAPRGPARPPVPLLASHPKINVHE